MSGNPYSEYKKIFERNKVLKIGDLIEYDNQLSNYDELQQFTGIILEVIHASNGWVYYDILIRGRKTRIWSGYVMELLDE